MPAHEPVTRGALIHGRRPVWALEAHVSADLEVEAEHQNCAPEGKFAGAEPPRQHGDASQGGKDQQDPEKR